MIKRHLITFSIHFIEKPLSAKEIEGFFFGVIRQAYENLPSLKGKPACLGTF